MYKVMMVCTGNTCRSPMAQALLREEIKKAGLESKIEVDSSGLCAFGGDEASRKAQSVMEERGVSLKDHRSKAFSSQMLETVDLFLTMTRSHKEMILSMDESLSGKVFTLLEFAGEGERDIGDPYGGDDTTYRETRNEIEETTKKVLMRLKSLI